MATLNCDKNVIENISDCYCGGQVHCVKCYGSGKISEDIDFSSTEALKIVRNNNFKIDEIEYIVSSIDDDMLKFKYLLTIEQLKLKNDNTYKTDKDAFYKENSISENTIIENSNLLTVDDIIPLSLVDPKFALTVVKRWKQKNSRLIGQLIIHKNRSIESIEESEGSDDILFLSEGINEDVYRQVINLDKDIAFRIAINQTDMKQKRSFLLQLSRMDYEKSIGYLYNAVLSTEIKLDMDIFSVFIRHRLDIKPMLNTISIETEMVSFICFLFQKDQTLVNFDVFDLLSKFDSLPLGDIKRLICASIIKGATDVNKFISNDFERFECFVTIFKEFGKIDDEIKHELKFIIEMNSEEIELINKYLGSYEKLVNGILPASTEARIHFIEVVQCGKAPQTNHEFAYWKYLKKNELLNHNIL